MVYDFGTARSWVVAGKIPVAGVVRAGLVQVFDGLEDHFYVGFYIGGFYDPRGADTVRGWRGSVLAEFPRGRHRPGIELFVRNPRDGDTRIQALVTLYLSGDDRLVRNAIQQFEESRIPDGLTQSRYPTDLPQLIPPF